MNYLNINKKVPHNYDWKGITITQTAEDHINDLMKKNSEVIGLHIDIKKSGCAGFTYIITLVKEHLNNDLKFLYKNISLFVSVKSIPFIDGTEIDYITEGLNQKFIFKNPKAQNICGCGASFSYE